MAGISQGDMGNYFSHPIHTYGDRHLELAIAMLEMQDRLVYRDLEQVHYWMSS
jgi:hypothetical protein